VGDLQDSPLAILFSGKVSCKHRNRQLLVTARCSTIGCVEGRPFTATDIVSIVFAVMGCHANHVVRRQHHRLHCKWGQLLPQMLCGSTECLYAHGEAPNASTQSSRQQSSSLLGHSCCTARWRYRRQHRQCSICALELRRHRMPQRERRHRMPQRCRVWLLEGACCKHLWVCRRPPLQRNCSLKTALCCNCSAVPSKQCTVETMQTNASFRCRYLIASQQQTLPRPPQLK
jgi:hypothetical protein